jgi:DNA-binding protein H-NS
MSTYQDYQKQIAELKRLASDARKSEAAAGVAKIREIMQTYGLTVADIGGVGKANSTKPKKDVAAKYRDTATGQQWTGRGRSPRWLEGKNKEDFLIK